MSNENKTVENYLKSNKSTRPPELKYTPKMTITESDYTQGSSNDKVGGIINPPQNKEIIIPEQNLANAKNANEVQESTIKTSDGESVTIVAPDSGKIVVKNEKENKTYCKINNIVVSEEFEAEVYFKDPSTGKVIKTTDITRSKKGIQDGELTILQDPITLHEELGLKPYTITMIVEFSGTGNNAYTAHQKFNEKTAALLNILNVTPLYIEHIILEQLGLEDNFWIPVDDIKAQDRIGSNGMKLPISTIELTLIQAGGVEELRSLGKAIKLLKKVKQQRPKKSKEPRYFVHRFLPGQYPGLLAIWYYRRFSKWRKMKMIKTGRPIPLPRRVPIGTEVWIPNPNRIKPRRRKRFPGGQGWKDELYIKKKKRK